MRSVTLSNCAQPSTPANGPASAARSNIGVSNIGVQQYRGQVFDLLSLNPYQDIRIIHYGGAF